MRLLTISLALALILSGTSLLHAAPSILGPSGLFTVPTAESLPFGAINANYYEQERAHGESFVFNSGVLPGLEVGFSRIRLDDSLSTPRAKQTMVNAKFTLRALTDTEPGISLGTIDMTDQVSTALYVVASENLPIGQISGIEYLRAHLGLAAGGHKNSLVPLNGVFGGLELGVMKHATFSVEHDSDSLNYGVRVQLFDGFTGDLAFVHEKHYAIYGLTYTHDM